MSEFRLSVDAEAELDGIWIYMARESGSIDIATPSGRAHRRAFLVAGPLSIHGTATRGFGSGIRSLAAGDYVILHRTAEDGVVAILQVMHGSRDIAALFGH